MISKVLKILIIALICTPIITCASSLNEMISGLVIDKIGSDVSEVELTFDQKSKNLLNDIKLRGIKNVNLTYFEPTYSSFRVSVTAEDDKLFDLFGRYKAFIDVPVLTKTISSGSIITASDIVSVKTPYARIKNGYATSLGEILGMQVRRAISGGSYIRKGDILKPQIIKQGDNVSMMYNQGNIKLRTNGVAAQSGAMGDNIKVKNDNTGIVVHGIIKGKNLVEVGR